MRDPSAWAAEHAHLYEPNNVLELIRQGLILYDGYIVLVNIVVVFISNLDVYQIGYFCDEYGDK